MSTAKPVERAAEWCYRGIWLVLTECFRVPSEPPRLPAHGDERVDAFKPSREFVRYLKFYFWIGLVVIDVLILGAWAAVLVAYPTLGIVLALPAWALAIVPDIVAYVAIHLRYDTTWYLLTDRAMRIRRGIWIIRETTITYENIQNVTVSQGPVQRLFGIARVTVQTAGGGGGEGKGHAMQGTHVGIIEGVTNAAEIRDRIMARVRRSTGAGLGDETSRRDGTEHAGAGAWAPEHVAVLREIRDRVVARGAG